MKNIGIFGISYCGSSLLMHMLSRSDNIFSVGESHHVFEDIPHNGRNLCIIHGKRCKFWTDELIAKALRSDNISPILQNAQKAYGVDSFIFTDKNEQFYRFMQNRGLSIDVAVVLIKRPEQFVGSVFRRMEYKCCETHVQDSLKKYINGYENILKYLIDSNIVNKMVVRYDRLIVDAEHELKMVCGFAGVKYKSDMLRYNVIDDKTHAIGGNTAFYTSLFGSDESFKHMIGRDNFKKIHKSWYSVIRKGLLINDRKWTKELSGDELSLIRNHDATKLYNRITRKKI